MRKSWRRTGIRFILFVFVLFLGNAPWEHFWKHGKLWQPKLCQAAVSEQEWKKSPAGSAGVLEGKSVLVSIYINDKTSKWTAKGRKETQKKVNSATRYIARQAKRYGKSVELIADTERYGDLGYKCRVNMKIKDGVKSQSRLYRNVKKYIDSAIDVTTLREKYGTDSIGFLFHVNKSGSSSTLVHYVEDETEYFYEASTLFSQYGGEAEGAATYAHEILHLFGARDLYQAYHPDGVTSSLVKHIERKFPNEIMYSTYTLSGQMKKYKITNDITRVTAYFLGWKKTIPERKKFSLPVSKQKGCFFIND